MNTEQIKQSRKRTRLYLVASCLAFIGSETLWLSGVVHAEPAIVILINMPIGSAMILSFMWLRFLKGIEE